MSNVPQFGELVTVTIRRRTVTGVLCGDDHSRSIRLPSGKVVAKLTWVRSVWREPQLCISGWSGGQPCEWVVTSVR